MYKIQNSKKILVLTLLITLSFVSDIVYAKLPGLTLGTVTATDRLSYMDYDIYADFGTNEQWARIIIKDPQGETVGTSTLNVGDIETFSDLNFDVALTDVWALEDGTILGADLAVDDAGKLMIDTVTATKSLDMTYSFCPVMGSEGSWVKIDTKDFYGDIVDTLTIKESGTKKSSVTDLSINPEDIMALNDGTLLSVKLFVGKTGSIDATTPLEYIEYLFYSDLGSNDNWARIIIKDEIGKSYLPITLNKGATRVFSDFYIKLLDIEALEDGTVLSVNIIVGNSEIVETGECVEHSIYRIYSSIGTSDNWARVEIKDFVSIVDTLTINKGEVKDSIIGVRIGLSDIEALLDGKVIAADIAVGSTGSEEPPITITTTTMVTTTTTIPATTTTTIPVDECDTDEDCPPGRICAYNLTARKCVTRPTYDITIDSFNCEPIEYLKARCKLEIDKMKENERYYAYVSGGGETSDTHAAGATTIYGTDTEVVVVVLSLSEDVYQLGAWVFEGTDPDFIRPALTFWKGDPVEIETSR